MFRLKLIFFSNTRNTITKILVSLAYFSHFRYGNDNDFYLIKKKWHIKIKVNPILKIYQNNTLSIVASHPHKTIVEKFLVLIKKGL